MKNVKARRKAAYSRRSWALAAAGALLIAVSVLACLIAKANPEGVTKHFTPYSRVVCSLLGRVMSVLPFSLGEVMLYLMAAGLIASVFLLIFRWAKRGGKKAVGRYFSVLALIAGCHAAFFVFTWGLNYFGQPLSRQLDLNVGASSKEELLETTRHYLSLANDSSENVPRRESDGAVDASDVSGIFASARRLYEDQQLFDWNGALISKPKKVMSWYFMSCFEIAGIFDPFTAECLVNTDSAPASFAFSACHELSHRVGYAPENEANFVSIMLCAESSDAILKYSGSYMGFIYCYNALAKVDRDAALELWDEMSPGLIADIRAANKHAEKYEDTVAAKVSSAVNDTYLKLMDQSGVQSYGEVVDMLIAEYLRSGSAG